MTMAPAIPRRLVFFGSSSIYGTNDVELGGFVNRLRLWHEQQDPRNRVYNLGIWGEQTCDLVKRIGVEAPARRPHALFIYPGFNDCRRLDDAGGELATPLEQFAELMHDLLSTSAAIAPTVVMTGYPFDESRTQPYQGTSVFYGLRDARQYTKRLIMVAKSLEIKVIDFFGKLAETDMAPLLAADGLHANAVGHQRLCDITRRFLETELVRPD
ncbi:MAG: GDSL-type esterase/lipase family protein [Planctomycetota bacterium]